VLPQTDLAARGMRVLICGEVDMPRMKNSRIYWRCCEKATVNSLGR
jgi:hypothetical protein